MFHVLLSSTLLYNLRGPKPLLLIFQLCSSRIMAGNKIKYRVVSPKSFPLDPRHEQTRTAITSIRPAGRTFEHYERDSSRLLSLPDELLWLITSFVAEQSQGRSLSQYALVHRDCRQLARPYQFADVWITRSDVSWEFLRHMKNEDISSRQPSIGSFIRSLTITIDKDFDSDFGLGPGPDHRHDEWEEYWGRMIEDLAQVVRSSLPNLDQVYWMDMAELDTRADLLPAVLQHAAFGRLQRIYFEDYGFFFSDWEGVEPAFRLCPDDQPFGLRDLAFGFNRWEPRYSDPEGATALFAERILRRSASTLESFVWSSQFEGEYAGGDPTMIDFRDGPIVFNKLRKFWSYTNADLIDIHPGVIECFLAAPLESFAPSSQICSVMLANGLVEKHPLPTLRTFAVTGVASDITFSEAPNYVNTVLRLGRRYGPQLKDLFIYLRGDIGLNDGIVGQLASHLSSGSFSNLRYLCFCWIDDPELQILKAIGSNLLMLEELSFGFQPDDERTCAFGQNSWNFSWSEISSPRHEDIIEAIAPLKFLVRLAVFGDEIIADWAGHHWAWHRFFKDHVWLHQGRSRVERESGPVPGEGQVWQDAVRGHKRSGDLAADWQTPWVTGKSIEDARNAVGDIAAKYAKAFPILQEFISGRVLVEITGR